MFFDADYAEAATLRDGTDVVIRPIRADDKELLRRGFLRLSPESRYRRFFAAKHDLSPAELRYLTEVDGIRHFALGATTADGRDGLAVARFIQLDGEPGVADAAIAVADEYQGKGLGSLLFQRLVAAAAERGVLRFRCEMLGSNQGMAELVLSLSPEAPATAVSAGVMSMEFALPPVAPAQPAGEPPRESGLYRFFGMVAKGEIEWTAAWKRIGLRFLGEDISAAARSWDGQSRDESE
jgi:GNAT superfamily N-acetyltransferase